MVKSRVKSCWVLVWWEAGPNWALGHGERQGPKLLILIPMLLGLGVVEGRACCEQGPTLLGLTCR